MVKPSTVVIEGAHFPEQCRLKTTKHEGTSDVCNNSHQPDIADTRKCYSLKILMPAGGPLKTRTSHALIFYPATTFQGRSLELTTHTQTTTTTTTPLYASTSNFAHVPSLKTVPAYLLVQTELQYAAHNSLATQQWSMLTRSWQSPAQVDLPKTHML